MSWDRVINQHHVKDVLRRLLRLGRVAHAYLFSGPPGAGMDAAAIEFARVLNCEAGGEDACEQCASCRQSQALQHPNIHLVFAVPTGKGEKSGDGPLDKLSAEDLAAVREQIALKSASLYHDIAVPRATAIKVNSVREIRREVSLAAFGKGRKVFVVLDAETMNDEAANALLKTLEEPPPGTILLLTTSSPENLLPTIVSRCQHLRFGHLGEGEIRTALMEREGVAPEEARLLAAQAEGSYARALSLRSGDYRDRQAEMVDFLRLAIRGASFDLLRFIEQHTANYDRQEIVASLQMLQSWLREAMLTRAGGERAEGGDEALRKFAAHYRNADYPAMQESLERSISLVEKNVYIPLVFTTLAASLEKSVRP